MGRRVHLKPIAALLSLSLLWTLETLQPELLPGLIPDSLPKLERQAIPLALLALSAGLYAAMRRYTWPHRARFLAAIGVGFGLFAVPHWLLALARGQVSEYSQVVLLTLTPLFALVFDPHIGSQDTASRVGLQGGYRLAAALCAVCGALLVFPLRFPDSIVALGAFCAVILAAASIAVANCWAVKIACNPGASERPAIATLAAISSGAASIALAASGIFSGQAGWRMGAAWWSSAPELAWSALLGLPALLLLFWTLPQMPAVATSTRYILAPLLAVLLGAALLHSPLEWRTWSGLVLMAAGSAGLLLGAEPKDDDRSRSVLHLE